MAQTARKPAAGRRKGRAAHNLGRVEDRFLADPGSAAEPAPEPAASSEEEEEEDSESDGERARRFDRSEAERIRRWYAAGEATVTVESPAQQRHRFAELPVVWQEVTSSPIEAESVLHVLKGGELRLKGQTDGQEATHSREASQTSAANLNVWYRAADGGLWHAVVSTPSQAAAEGLITLLQGSCKASCGMDEPAGAAGPRGKRKRGVSSSLNITLGLLADRWHCAGHPEDQKQTKYNQSLLAVTAGWLLPWLDPERQLEPNIAAAGASDGAVPGASSDEAEGFDASEIYAAVKPTGGEPELPAGAAASLLLPTLRRYQSRAAQWMVDREQGISTAAPPAEEAGSSASAAAAGKEAGLHPLWRRVPCAAGCFYMNPFNGAVSFKVFKAGPQPRGGILADEMGLGKTVELLACIASNRYTGPSPSFKLPSKGKRKQDTVACVCGATSEEGYSGLWIQCDQCSTWMHAACLGLRRAPLGDFVCGSCQHAAAASPVTQRCGATLVVCPTPILHQWRDEILKHIQPGSMKLLIYEGQQQPRPGEPSRIITAAELAAADIVLTTYEVLRRDVHLSSDEYASAAARTLRGRKKYHIMPTPLTRLRWWRVCLDEAQMVESSTAKAAKMAMQLEAVHRWCVTGTPMSRGLQDLFGLLSFLQVAPYNNTHWWRRCVQEPYDAGSQMARARLLKLLRPALGGLLWRSSKADVALELNLPPQHHNLTHLQMNAIERHFYRRQHDECLKAGRATLSSELLATATAAAAVHDGTAIVGASDAAGTSQAGPSSLAAQPQSPSAATAAAAAQFRDRALTRREETSLMHPLLRLRQACCHPQVGGRLFLKAAGGGGPQTKAPMTMGEVLEVMLTKSRVEAEDAQRLLLASLNGLAGLLALQELPADAVRLYREALATMEQNKPLIRADKLQQLHTLTNLAAVLDDLKGSGIAVAPTLRDSKLLEEADEIRQEYLAESAASLAAHSADLDDVHKAVQRCKAPLLRQVTAAQAEELLLGWFMRAVALIAEHGRDQHSQHAVAQRIKDQVKEETIYLRSVSQNATSIASKFRDLYGLELVLKQELGEYNKAQAAATNELQRLQVACQNPSPGIINLAATCGRCRQDTAVAGVVCRHCRLEELFWGWEGRAFALYSKAREGAGNVTAEEAIQQAQHDTLHRVVGRGGLGEASKSVEEEDEEGSTQLLLGAGRRDNAAAGAQIVRRPGDVENVLRLLLNQLRQVKVPSGKAEAEKELVMTAGKAHLDLLEQYRRLYLKSRALGSAQRQRLYALDELEQCTMRIKLLDNNELRQDREELFRVYRAELPVRFTELSNDKASAELELRARMGTLRYLLTVKAREASKAAASGEPALEGAAEEQKDAQQQQQANQPSTGDGSGSSAAASQQQLPGGGSGPAGAAVMLSCAHRLCCKCCLALQERLADSMPEARRRIQCPVCRTAVPVSEIVYIDTRLEVPGAQAAVAAEAADGEERIEVKGSYGTKLEAVVARLISLTRASATSRVLVHALTTNGLPHLHPSSSKKFEQAVLEFRAGHEAAMAAADAPSSSRAAAAPAKSAHPQVLLLLMQQGSNGLNLTEAQHVVLVEPSLNPAVEAQAVGRVDRIGQTRATHVHRFVVQHTIEENVHRLCQQRAAAMDLSAASVTRAVGNQKEGALTVRDVAQLLRRPEDGEEMEEEWQDAAVAGAGGASQEVRANGEAAAGEEEQQAPAVASAGGAGRAAARRRRRL
ncbi:E3 ubiquitin-protein ligase [Chlorella vulgaris]